MRIACCFLPKVLDEVAVVGKTCVVFDVLRASTTITALGNGCRRIIPVATPAEAHEMKRAIAGGEPGWSADREVLLAGEREGRTIPGFDLGNSPAEFSAGRIGGKTVIMCTTNGTAAILAARAAALVLIGGFINLSAVARAVRTSVRHDLRAENLVLICAGKEGGESLEDAVACGALIDLLGETRSSIGASSARHDLRSAQDMELDDGALIALGAFRASRDDILGVLEKGNHGRYLASIGFGSDLALCARRDTSAVVPYFDAAGRSIRIYAE
jgi:2-phosphosulfolactate phosphatase